MLTGLDGKIMTYDGENRPLSVTYLGKKTCYVYGADGTRRKKIENYSPTQSCDAPTAAQTVTAYLGSVEIRKFGQGTAEEILLYPHASIRISKTKDAGGAIITGVSTLHRDAKGSVRAVTTAAGMEAENTVYRPFGEETTTVNDLATAPETKDYIGERFDADAGLQYLNARYYDPKLGMFTQPDWWEVTQAGVGTNRYSYSFNDPINSTDASGHAIDWAERNREYNRRTGAGNYAYGDNDLERQRNGLHDSSFDWSKGSNSVKIGNEYLTANEYDALKRAGCTVQMRAGGGGAYLGPIPKGNDIYFKNLKYLDANPYLKTVAHSLKFAGLAILLLEASDYKGRPRNAIESGGAITLNVSTGKWTFEQTFDPTANRTRISISVPQALKGQVSIVIHTHPASGAFLFGDVAQPSREDLDGPFPGFVVSRTRGIYGYYDGGWK